MAAPKLGGSKIGGSPLLGASAQKPPVANSTINLEKMDKSRFSEMKEMESENSSLRIIVYVLIVIVIGVGLALLVRQLIANQQPPSNSNQNPVSNPVSSNSALELSTTGVSDTLATNVAKNEDYLDSALLTLGDEGVDMESTSLDKIRYTDYSTFSRMIFDLSSSTAKLPKVNLAYDASKLTLTVEVVDLVQIASSLRADLDVDSLVSEIRFDKVNTKYIIFLTEKFKYRVYADKDNLVIDFKTLTELAKPEAEEEEPVTPPTAPTTPVTPVVPPTTSGNKPAAPHYENSFSQTKQYVSSAVTGATITLNNYYVWDEGTFFEFSWAEEGEIGDDYVPNASAELVTEGGVNYIDVTIENLKGANLSNGVTAAQIESVRGFSMAGANFVGVTRTSFDVATGKAVYRVELKKKADFQLLSQETYDGNSQILSIQIKD